HTEIYTLSLHDALPICIKLQDLTTSLAVFSRPVLLNWQRCSVTSLTSPCPQGVREPTCFKKATIIPIRKHPSITCLNDYHPVALTFTIMKCFERLVRTHICSTLPNTLDPFQFAYRPKQIYKGCHRPDNTHHPLPPEKG